MKLTGNQQQTIRAFVNRVDKRLAKMRTAWGEQRAALSNDKALLNSWFEQHATTERGSGMEFANDDGTRFLSLAKVHELEDQAAGPKPAYTDALAAQLAEDLK